MPLFIVVNNPQEWPLEVPGVSVISARSYLTEPQYADLHGARVFNFCRSYRYQTVGYYVSLLAAARGHKPFPSITTIQDMKSPTIARLMSDELEELIQESLAGIRSNKFTLSIYFGKNVAKKYNRLSAHLFQFFQAPFLRAQFVRNEHWDLRSIGPISAMEIPDQHHPFVIQVASDFFTERRFSVQRKAMDRYDLAIDCFNRALKLTGEAAK